ncbi:PAS domain-containing protein [Thalassobaculum sp. OXR-137]|uniref:PAS domain-containing protein n=1 Tax=Thalassobaculum sp. OXR-137 TaxID=3100173 RepID=UPI002AC9DE05|nr:PAS domain-containing protein [Thalassobaculum sp. OXR-137]WPZ34009.1 PAS domain-containing protein [Thalassobaculum sp. OXR-137]
MTDDASRPSGAHTPLYERIFDDMSDGVMAVTRQGRIVAFNPTAAEILAVDAEDVLQGALFQLIAEDGRNDALIDTITEAIDTDQAVVERVLQLGTGETARSLQVRTSRLRDETGDGGGVVVVFQDITEIESLRLRDREMAENLKAQNGELQDAYRDLDRKSKELEQTGKRLQIVRLGATGFVLVLFVGLGVINFSDTLPTDFGVSSGPADGAQEGQAALYTVYPTPVRDVVTVTGSLNPGAVVNITMPFAGRIDTRLFEYGVPVTEGSVLLSLSSTDMETQLANAHSAFIKAQRNYQDIETWTTGDEVAESRRRLDQAQYALDDAIRALEETKRLFERGIIARQEMEGQVQRVRSQRDALASAQSNLDRVLERGDEQSRRIAALELQNARRALESLENQAEGAIIVAPVSGLPFAPITGKDKTPVDLAVGSRVEAGVTALSIGDVGQFSVAGEVDEVDIANIRNGQLARVTGPAFPGIVLEGHVEAIEAQAQSAAAGRGGLARFGVRVRIPSIPEEARGVIRVGMSATVQVVVYEAPEALVVPTTAIGSGPDGPQVRVWRGDEAGLSGTAEPATVTLGRPVPAGIEVLSGLTAGDRIVLP